MNLGTVNGSSETKPNPENCKNWSSKCAYDCAQHLSYDDCLEVRGEIIRTVLCCYTAQNSSDNLPSYLQTIIIAQMLSIGGKGGGVSVLGESATKANH